MQLIRRPRPGHRAVLPGCVATIGVFDGMHLGHQRILHRVQAEAARRGLPSVVFSFEPTPQEVLRPDSAPARLMRFREKAAWLDGAGLDWLYCPPFGPALRDLAPGAFVEQLLVGLLGVRHLVVGDDFRFARDRAGRLDDLEQGGRRFGFSVEQVGSVTVAGTRVSSTAIRGALAAGDLPLAQALLGRPYAMAGRVAGGLRLGRQLGFPTANVRLNRRQSPVQGIFAVRVAGVLGHRLDGVASVGTRPTVAGTEPLLEVHIFDFDQDIYGRHIQVEFIARLRDEVRFPDLEALRRQMEVDAAEARRILAGP